MSNGLMPSQQRVDRLYCLLQIGFWGMMAAFTGYQTAIVLNRGFSSGQAGIFISLGCLAGIFAQPLLGAWADRHPKTPLKYIFGLCMLGALMVHGVFYIARPGFLGTAVIFLALGVLETNSYPLIDAMAMQFLNAGLNVRYSLGRGLGAFSYAVVSVLAGQLAQRCGVESALWIHGGMVVLILLTLAVFPAFPLALRPQTGPRERPHSFGQILRRSPLFALMLGAGFFAIAAVMPIVNFMVNLVSDRGGGSAQLGLALFLMAASELPGALLFQWLWKRLGSTKVMLLAVGFMMLKPVLFLLCQDLTAFLALQPIQMLGYGLFTPCCVYFANENVAPEDRVQGQTLKMVVTNGLGGMVGNLAGGAMIDWGGVDAMLVMCALFGGLGLALALLAVFLGRDRKRPACS